MSEIELKSENETFEKSQNLSCKVSYLRKRLDEVMQENRELKSANNFLKTELKQKEICKTKMLELKKRARFIQRDFETF